MSAIYLRRQLFPTLQTALSQFPAVLVTGPRQSGKTTFLREEFGDRFAYVTFDDPLTRAFATSDPRRFLDPYGNNRSSSMKSSTCPNCCPT